MEKNTKLKNFYNELEKLRKPKSDDPYDNRVTHCLLLHEYQGKTHRFDVRGWNKIKGGKLYISVVNWTMCAGTASLELDEGTVDKFIIEEDIYKV
jgi:hypothetical protein